MLDSEQGILYVLVLNLSIVQQNRYCCPHFTNKEIMGLGIKRLVKATPV